MKLPQHRVMGRKNFIGYRCGVRDHDFLLLLDDVTHDVFFAVYLKPTFDNCNKLRPTRKKRDDGR